MERVRNCVVHEGFLYPSEFLQCFPSFMLGCRTGCDFARVKRELCRGTRGSLRNTHSRRGNGACTAAGYISSVGL